MAKYQKTVDHNRVVLLVCEVKLAEPEVTTPFGFAHVERRVCDALTD